MEYLIVSLAAFGASLLTFFSGFGLGTILLPVFALFFSIETSILLTAIVHFLNNILKTGMMKNFINLKTILWFGVPAMIFSYFGASLLTYISEKNYVITTWQLFEHSFTVTFLSLVIGGLIFTFALTELIYGIKNIKASPRFLIFGGALSGFLGGLSGHQGALRSVFLLQLQLKKEVFIATGIAIALCVDITRIGKYLSDFGFEIIYSNQSILIVALIAAFIGAIIGRTLLKKVTIEGIKYTVGITMIILSLGIATGILSK